MLDMSLGSLLQNMLQPASANFCHHKNVEQYVSVTNKQQKLKSLYKSQSQCKDILR